MKLKYRVIERFRGKYSIEAMCEVFEVSRSGYYAWRNRQQKEAKDQWLVDLVVACQRQSKQTYGIRRVRRWIQRQTGKLVNVKAILRVMRKLNLLSVVRRRRPYTRYQQAVHKNGEPSPRYFFTILAGYKSAGFDFRILREANARSKKELEKQWTDR